MNDLSIQFIGFSPSGYIKDYFTQYMERIQNEAPTTSHIRMTVARINETYRAHIQINSSAGRFHADANEGNVFDLTHVMTRQLHHQLEKWKDRRHRRESIKHLRDLSLRQEWAVEREVSDEAEAEAV